MKKIPVGSQDKENEKGFYDRMFSHVVDGHFISHGYEEIYRKTIDRVLGGLALDVGCGTGKHSVNLSKKGFKTVAMDLSLKGVLVAKAHADKEKARVFFIVGDAEHMPFNNEKFDVVFCALILHHFKDLTAISIELSRVAKGFLFSLETNALEPMTFLKFNIFNPLLKPKFMTPNQRALFPKTVQGVFEKQGFANFEFSWIDIHVPYQGVIGRLTKWYAQVMKIIPVKNRCNKFLMSCAKSNHLRHD
jgi:ubiquinone/menaquinone biosynthesis C-methylase UbiE